MKNLSITTFPALIDNFREVCRKQYATYMTDNARSYNKLFDELIFITRELKRRGVEERRALMGLLADENPQVRFQAANFVYAVAPVEAKACLERLAAADLPNQSLAAGMTLSGLEDDPHCLDWI